MTFLITIISTLIVTAVLLSTAKKWALIDYPGDHRGHDTPTPIIGGIAMFVGSMVGIFWHGGDWSFMGSLLLSGGFILGVGIWDDRHDTTYLFRFVGQLIAAAILIKTGGVVLDDLGHLVSDQLMPLNRWSVALTLLAIVGVVNAYNMSDGIDGLAGSLSLITVAALIIVAIFSGHIQDANYLMIFGSAIFVFLMFNVRVLGYMHARIFMGDAGSMWLGFIISCFLIKLSQGEFRAMTPVTALWITAVPLFDAVSSLVRRAIRGKSPFQADRAHYHHYLLGFGYNVNQVVIIASASALAIATVGLVLERIGVRERLMFFGFLGMFVCYVVILEFAERKLSLFNERKQRNK